MNITILSATTETVPTAKGSYQKLELAYKGEDGQVKGKKIMSFGAAAKAFQVLSKAQSGEVYEITAVKNEGTGYWDWTNASKANSVAGGTDSRPVAANVGTGVVKSNYETAEERARKQVYIVRQSSLATAVDFLKNDESANTDLVISVAKQFEAYVFDTGTPPAAEFVGDEDQVI